MWYRGNMTWGSHSWDTNTFNPEAKILVFSDSDSTSSPVFISLNLSSDHCLPFSKAILILSNAFLMYLNKKVHFVLKNLRVKGLDLAVYLKIFIVMNKWLLFCVLQSVIIHSWNKCWHCCAAILKMLMYFMAAVIHNLTDGPEVFLRVIDTPGWKAVL